MKKLLQKLLGIDDLISKHDILVMDFVRLHEYYVVQEKNFLELEKKIDVMENNIRNLALK